MPNRPVLEICVESVDHAVAAERGGADRLEFCSDLSSGGITPSLELMQNARQRVSVPIHVLIRPRAGDFLYSDPELEVMRHDIQAAKQCKMDGIVLGILHENNRVDVERTQALVELARPLPVTFHRAFDASANLETALEDVIQTGASRILTSGGQARATDGLATLTRLVEAARDRILLMVCGGINAENVLRIVQTTLAQEIHSSAGSSRLGATDKSALFEQKVAMLVSLLGSLSNNHK
jgi:copper homeostasis protein